MNWKQKNGKPIWSSSTVAARPLLTTSFAVWAIASGCLSHRDRMTSGSSVLPANEEVGLLMPEEPVARDARSVAPVVGQHGLSFNVAIASSCSQSWDLSTHDGAFALAIDERGQVGAELSVFSRSQGPGYDTLTHADSRRPQVCRWRGRADEVKGRAEPFVVELQTVPSPDRTPYPCAIDDHQNRTRLSHFRLACRQPRPDEGETQYSLVCTRSGPAPWLLGFFERRGAIHLGREGRVHIEFRDDDSIQGTLIKPVP